MGTQHKSPLARAGANRAYKGNVQQDFTKESNDLPSPHPIAAYAKNILVQLGVNGILPRRLCTKIINLLGLRGE